MRDIQPLTTARKESYPSKPKAAEVVTSNGTNGINMLEAARGIPSPGTGVMRGYSSGGDSSYESDNEFETFQSRAQTGDRVGLCKLKDTISVNGGLNSKVIRLEVRNENLVALLVP